MVGKEFVCDNCYPKYRNDFLLEVLKDRNVSGFWLQQTIFDNYHTCSICKQNKTNNMYYKNLAWLLCSRCHHNCFTIQCDRCGKKDDLYQFAGCQCTVCKDNDLHDDSVCVIDK